jgi:uncharacterized protein YprB with RNaseH-like and TPR domain
MIPQSGFVKLRQFPEHMLSYAKKVDVFGKPGSRLQLPFDAFLDIETTGLISFYDEITVLGIYLANNAGNRLVQLVGEDVTKTNLLRTLRCVDTIYTYNGSRFDFPFIHFRLGVNLREHFHHRDLMHDCWRNNLYGGFKAVERQLGIPRRLQGIAGAEAPVLWWRYQVHHDRKALDLLLEYNKEDVVNLMALKGKLQMFSKSRRCY